MKAFIPPSFNLPLHWTVDLLFPLLAKQVENIDEIIISDEDKHTLRKLRKERLLFFTNHPTTAEPPITYHIGNVMGARFKYMASRQVFDWTFGVVGKVISNIGAFSIIAGINDRESFKTARAVLAAPAGKLVLYPEGEPTSGENDSLMPFQSGVSQLSFWALDDAIKAEPDADIMILPGFIKYVMTPSPAECISTLTDSIAKIEKKLSINPGSKNLLRRFMTVGRVLLEQHEEKYKIPKASKSDFDYRIGRVRHAILDNVAEKTGIAKYDKKADAIIKLRQLFALHEMISIGYEDPNLPNLSKDEMDWMHSELTASFDLIVIKRDYLLSRPTPERFFEWLVRYESLVFDRKPRAIGGEPWPLPRKAHVRLAEPFSLREYWSTDKKKKKAGVKNMLTRLRKDIQGLLDDCLELSQPIVKPYDIGDDFY